MAYASGVRTVMSRTMLVVTALNAAQVTRDWTGHVRSVLVGQSLQEIVRLARYAWQAIIVRLAWRCVNSVGTARRR